MLNALESDISLLETIVVEAENPGKRPKSVPDRIRHWVDDQKLMDLVRFGCLDEDGRRDTFRWSTYTLSSMNIEKLLQVSPKMKTIKESPIEVRGAEPGIHMPVIPPSPPKRPKKKAPPKKVVAVKKKKAKKKTLKREKKKR